jgi:hypothetical protein
MMKSNLTLLLLMTKLFATGDNPYKEDLTDKDDLYCDKINMDADDVSYEVVDCEQNTIALRGYP